MTSLPNISPLAVLLVEDHADSRQMYAEFLRMQFTVVEAGDGINALEVMEQTRPDVVVTDLALPRMDGFELVRRMKADERLRDVPVIALSGFRAPTTRSVPGRRAPASCSRSPVSPTTWPGLSSPRPGTERNLDEDADGIHHRG
jgi:CheY-like chemotaxis protein